MKIKHERLDLEIARVRNLLNERNTTCAQHLIDLENQILILKSKSVIKEKRFSKPTRSISSSSLSSQAKVEEEEEEDQELLYHIKNGNRIVNNEKSSKKSSLISISRAIAGKFIKAKKPSAECIPMVPDKRVFTKR
jgi:hypothetical protein